MARLFNGAHVSKKDRSGVIDIIIKVFLFIVMMVIIGKYAVIKAPSFWVASFIEIGLAFIAFRIRPYSQNRIIILLAFALLIPVILASNISVLMPIVISPAVFLVAAFVIQTTYKLIHRPKDITFLTELSLNLDFHAVFPSGLSLEFEQVNYHVYKKKYQTILELYFKKYDGTWFSIFQSDKTIVFNEIKRQTQKSEKIINNVHVSLIQEIKQKPLFAKKPENLYVVAKWSYNTINFLLRSGGVSSDDVEKILASMIK